MKEYGRTAAAVVTWFTDQLLVKPDKKKRSAIDAGGCRVQEEA